MEETSAIKSSRRRTSLITAFAGSIIVFSFSTPLMCQSGSYPDRTETPASSIGTGRGAAVSGPFSGSVPQGKVREEVLPLSFQEAIDLGLKNNLGLLLQADNTVAVRGQKWKELSDLLPNTNAGITENAEKINLAAEGLRFPGLPTIVGPFGSFDARLFLKQSTSLSSIQRI